jgi:hypothetical protein
MDCAKIKYILPPYFFFSYMETANLGFDAVQSALAQVAVLVQQGIRNGKEFRAPAAVINAEAGKIGYRCRCVTCADCDMAFYLTQAGQAVLAIRNTPATTQ